MINLLGMLQGVNNKSPSAATQPGAQVVDPNDPQHQRDRFQQALTQKAMSLIHPSDKSVGMQFANAGLNAPAVTNMMSMLSGLNNLTQQQGGSRGLQVYDLMNMLGGQR